MTTKAALLTMQSLDTTGAAPQEWICLLPTEVPEWVKNPDVVGHLIRGEIASHPLSPSICYRAVQPEWSVDSAIAFARAFLFQNREAICTDDTPWGAEKWKQLVLHDLTELWIYQIAQSSLPDPRSELAYQVHCKLNFLLNEAAVNRDAYDATIAVAECLTDRNQTIPSILADWLARPTADKTPPRRNGKSKHANWGRDLHIAYAVYLLEMTGIKPTRNDATEISCGCSIVADIVAEDMGIPINYEMTKAIWKRYSKARNLPSEL